MDPILTSNSVKNLLRDFFVPCKENGFKPKVLETQAFVMFLGFLFALKILTLISFWGNFGATIFNQVALEDLYVLANETRVANGVNKLQSSSKLEAVAQLKLADMFQNNYFAHISPAGVDPWYWFDRINYDYKIAGENLAMNFMSSNEVMDAWLNSESHKKNLLLKDFQETGIAVGSGVINGQKTVVVVQVFGTSRTPVLAVQTKPAIKSKQVVKPKPSVIPKLKIDPVISVSPAIIAKNEITPKIEVRPEIKSEPISLRKAIANFPQVKSAVEERKFLSEYGPFFANDGLRKLMIVLAIFTITILILKIFVAFHIQFPWLIFRAIILIMVSVSFVLIKDESLMFDKTIITDYAEIIILGNK